MVEEVDGRGAVGGGDGVGFGGREGEAFEVAAGGGGEEGCGGQEGEGGVGGRGYDGGWMGGEGEEEGEDEEVGWRGEEKMLKGAG